MRTVVAASLLLVAFGATNCLAAEDVPASQPDAPTLDQKFPGLTVGCLSFARLERLPAGVLLRSDELTVTEDVLSGVKVISFHFC